jgi:hypothetical protein
MSRQLSVVSRQRGIVVPDQMTKTREAMKPK